MDTRAAVGRLARRTAAILVALAAAGSVPALGQGWSWPWGSPSPPVPREPVYRGPPPQDQPPPGQPPPGQSYDQPYTSSRSPLCLQLEQRLAQDATRGGQTREAVPRIESEMRQLERTFQAGEAQLERSNCYDYFLFARSIRQTRACVDLGNQVESAKRRYSDLDQQRQQILGTSSRSYREDIIRELAYNNCGAAYQQESRRLFNPFASLWQDRDSGSSGGNQFSSLPFATYRTICVRLCDGYYFPISFSTLPNYFDRDAQLCQSRCAAPSELYFHQNPGAGVEQAISFESKLAYTSLKTAFRYRKEYVKGCSCNVAEYVPQDSIPKATGRRAQAGDVPPNTPRR
jgi:hypothetical protein